MEDFEIEELAEILVRLFECEDMIKVLQRSGDVVSADQKVRVRTKKLALEWFGYLGHAHEDLQDLLPGSPLSVHLDETGTYR